MGYDTLPQNRMGLPFFFGAVKIHKAHREAKVMRALKTLPASDCS